MRSVCVLGVCGFIGREFERYVADNRLHHDWRFVGIDTDISRGLDTGHIAYVRADALDTKAMLGLMEAERPQLILNLVGTFRSPSFENLLALNVRTTQVLCEAVIASGAAVEKIVIVGSAAEYGAVEKNPVDETTPLRPVTLYGLTKAYQTQLAEFYHRVHGLPTVVARTFNILGEGQSRDLAVGNFLRQIEQAGDGDEIRVGNLDSRRDYMPVREVAASFWRLLLWGNPGTVYNVASGRPTRLADLLDQLVRKSGKRLVVKTDPRLLKPVDVPVVYGDNTRLRELEQEHEHD